MRLKTAAATAPALQIQTRPAQTRLRAVSGKGAASNSAALKPMATSPSLHSRMAPKAASVLSAVPRKTVATGAAQTDSARTGSTQTQPNVAKSSLKPAAKLGVAKPSVSQLSAAQQSAKLARRDRIVLEHLPLVKAIAIRVHENLPVHVDVDDLVHSGVLGLFDAASKYNPDKQVAFSSYAKHRIKGAILDSLRQLDWASRDMRRRHKQVEAATRELAATLQRNPTELEVAQKLGIDPERWRSMMLDLRNVGLVSASTRTNEGDDLPAPDFPCKPESHPDSICSREQLRGVLGVAMKTLPERYQKVVSLYYSAEMTMKEIGGILGINESRVSQIHKAALEKMQVVLQNNGISSPQAF
jgi:RNA polymerase sigma factor for flagellar operon FliA